MASSGLSGIVLPPPVVDPFSSHSNTESFPKGDFKDDFSTLTTAFGQQNKHQEYFDIKPATAAAPVVPAVPTSISPAAVSAPTAQVTMSAVSPAVSNSSANESFANFDAVQFDTIAGKNLHFSFEWSPKISKFALI